MIGKKTLMERAIWEHIQRENANNKHREAVIVVGKNAVRVFFGGFNGWTRQPIGLFLWYSEDEARQLPLSGKEKFEIEKRRIERELKIAQWEKVKE
jgi:hypothetical protein